MYDLNVIGFNKIFSKNGFDKFKSSSIFRKYKICNGMIINMKVNL